MNRQFGYAVEAAPRPHGEMLYSIFKKRKYHHNGLYGVIVLFCQLLNSPRQVGMFDG